MSCCCQNVYGLCYLVPCQGADIVLPIPIPADGVYFMELDFLGNTIRVEAPLSEGNNATFENPGLNEQFTYIGKVVDILGQPVSFVVTGQTYDCFEFTTKRVLNDTSSDS